MFKKIIFSVMLSFACCLGLASCGTYYCDYCGDKASWKAQETFLGEAMGEPVYVCAACKRDGKGPRPSVSGNTITWTHL